MTEVIWISNEFAIKCGAQEYRLPIIDESNYTKGPVVRALYLTHRQLALPTRIQIIIMKTLKLCPDYFTRLPSIVRGGSMRREEVAPKRRGRPPGSKNKKKRGRPLRENNVNNVVELDD